MTREFVYEALPMRVAFGAGRSRDVAAELDALGLGRVLVLSTPEQKDVAGEISRALGERSAGLHAEAVQHVPVGIARAAVAVAGERGADGCVAVGGGSTIGLGKAIALETGLPIVAVPTTYAGSEMTPVWGLTEGGRKRTGRDRRVLPRSVIYDPELTLTLPPSFSVTSGMNAIAHAVEALYAPDTSPVIGLMAAECARAMAGALPRVAASPAGPDARADALYAAWLGGACLGATTMGLHHRLCHALGGTFDLPHAEMHTIMLPYVLAFNAPAVPEAMDALTRALGTDAPARALREIGLLAEGPHSLADLGVAREALDTVAAEVAAAPYSNPRPAGHTEIRTILEDAWHGTPP
jgi:maleylacetate reductase